MVQESKVQPLQSTHHHRVCAQVDPEQRREVDVMPERAAQELIEL